MNKTKTWVIKPANITDRLCMMIFFIKAAWWSLLGKEFPLSITAPVSADSGVIVVDPHMELYAPPGHGKTARNYEELQKAIKERDEAKNVPK